MKSNNIYYVIKTYSSSFELLKLQIFPDVPYFALAVDRIA